MKRGLIFAIAAIAGLCTTSALRASETTGPTETPEVKEPKFDLQKTNIVMPEFPVTEAYTLETDEHDLTFIPPRDARVLIDPKKREVRFYYRDERCLIILRHGDVNPALVATDSWDKLRDIVKGRYADAEVSEGAACRNSCGAGGCSFTIRRKTGYGNLTVMTHLSFIPIDGGVLEVSMAAADHKFPAQLGAFRNFLNCLRLEQKDNSKVRLAGN
jgi:hypothetical protein